jgi:DHA1 family tetracycline resistance protein-like MFS transporter
MSPTALIFCTVFLDLIGFGIVLPLLPSYAAALHVGETRIGILVASFSLMQFLLAHWWGRLSDRIGRRPVLLVGLAGSALSYLLFAFAANYWVLLLSRVVAGAMGATVNVAQAYLADVSTPEERPRAMGLLGAAFGLGFVVGPGIGGVTSLLGDKGPGLVASGLTAVNFLLAWRWLPESRPSGHVVPEARALPWGRFAEPFLATGCATVAFTVLYVVFPLEVERALGYSRQQSAYLFVLIGLVGAVVQGTLIGRLVGRFGEARLIRGGSLLLAAGLLVLPAAFLRGGGAASLALLMGGLLITAMGSSVIAPSAASMVSRMAPVDEQGRALGMLQGVASMARIGGPLLAGAVAAGFGTAAAFAVASGVAVLAGLVGLARAPGAA